MPRQSNLLSITATASGVVLCAGITSMVLAQQPRGTTPDARQHWTTIETVLTHPRCLNCHTSTAYPRQSDDRHRHQFRVLRGPAGKGVPGALCTTCHQSANAAVAGPPGAPDWHAAPLSMAWEVAPGTPMSGRQLCRTLLDTKRNGNRNLAALQSHLASDALVRWAWAPGNISTGEARMTPPVSHEVFLAALKSWADADAPCP
jgi:hypothetical protein